jgi:type II secretory pathway component GspD/PulD (secretin)
MRSVDKAAIPPKGDIEFDADHWRDITKRRNKSTMTKKEKELLKALDSTINLGFKDAPFEEVMKSISTSLGQNILLDKSALQSAMIETNTPVSVNLRGVAVRSALRSILQDHGLTYIIKDESIRVVTLDQARSTLVTRVYYLGDLIRGVGAIGGAAALQFGPVVDMMQTQNNANRIIEMIKAIDPLSWRDNGGSGSVTFNLPSMSIIVRQTAEFHSLFGGSIGGR